MLTEHVTSPWVTLVLEMSELRRTASSSLKTFDAEGTRTSVRQPLALHSLESELRTVTYRTSSGAFIGATVTVTAEGATAEYNVDAIEPRHAEFAPADIAPAFHADLKRYSRQEAAIPAWLVEMLRHSPQVRLARKR